MADWQNYPSNAAPAAADTLLSLDVSDTSANAAGTVKQVTVAALEAVLVPDAAAGLESATTTVAVSGATAPGAGDVLTATSSTAAAWAVPPVVNVVTRAGADSTGTADSTAAITAAITAAGPDGTVYFPPGTYKTSSTVTVGSNVVFAGAGKWITTWKYTGSGDCLRIQGAGGSVRGPGHVSGIMFDGSGSTGPSAGLHLGDVVQARLEDVGVQYYNQAGSIGLHLDNNVAWTERLHGDVYARGCTSHVVFDVTGTGYNSFARTDLDIWIDADAGQDAVVVRNGALPYDAKLAIRGNMAAATAAPSPLNAVLRVTGTGSTANCTSASGIWFSRLDIGVEGAPGTSVPQTIAFGDLTANAVKGCYGVLDFSAYTALAASNWTPAYPAAFTFTGPVYGDSALSGVGGSNKNGALVATAPVRVAPLSTGTLATLTDSTASADVGTWTLPADDAQAGSRYRLAAFGLCSSAASSPGTLSILVQLDGTTLAAFTATTLTASLASAPWAVECTFEFSAVGTSASVHSLGTLANVRIGGTASDNVTDARVQTVDSTAAQNLTVLAQFSVASASNTVSVAAGTLTREAY